MAIFDPFQVRVDPWEVDYGTETPLEAAPAESGQNVRLDVEVAAGDWRPVGPKTAADPTRVYFVDGVRRLDARLQVRDGARYLHGAFASYAVGAAEYRAGRSTFAETRQFRNVVFGSARRPANPVAVRPALTYQPESAAGDESDAPLRRVQSEMRRQEGLLSRRLADDPGAVVVSDGPLSFDKQARGAAVGYVKRITELYLPASHVRHVTALAGGERTPVFEIWSSEKGFQRLAWFLRLADRRRQDPDFFGLVRLEVHQTVGKDAAVKLADLTAVLLPRFAPPRGRDPRSPQNLFPIGALEDKLRHELGDRTLFRRWIETLVAREAVR